MVKRHIADLPLPHADLKQGSRDSSRRYGGGATVRKAELTGRKVMQAHDKTNTTVNDVSDGNIKERK